jgi:hypothetical protein
MGRFRERTTGCGELFDKCVGSVSDILKMWKLVEYKSVPKSRDGAD